MEYDVTNRMDIRKHAVHFHGRRWLVDATTCTDTSTNIYIGRNTSRKCGKSGIDIKESGLAVISENIRFSTLPEHGTGRWAGYCLHYGPKSKGPLNAHGFFSTKFTMLKRHHRFHDG